MVPGQKEGHLSTLSPFRRTRVLLALGPFAGALGMVLGVAFGLDGHGSLLDVPSADLGGLVLPTTFLGSLATLAAAGLGLARGRPFHALKACATMAVLLFFPGMFLGVLIAGAGC